MWPFSKKKALPGYPTILPFKDTESFFEYQCNYGHTDLIPKQGVVGLVKIVSRDEKSQIQNATLQIASRDGGFETFSQTEGTKGDKLSVGDVVIWVPLQRDPLLAAAYKGDERSAWMGLIVARVAPEIDLTTEKFKLLCKFS